MIDLEFLGPAGDGESLVFTDRDGERYRVSASSELRAEVGRLLLQGVVPEEPKRDIGPGQIQSMLRSGLSPLEIAEQIGSDVERVIRYYAPVEAEINRAVQLAQDSRVGAEPDSPTMGDLVIDRLAARGVDVETVSWSASKNPDEDWVTTLSFTRGDVLQTARWTNPGGTGRVVALDPLAQELTETVEISSSTNPLFPPAPLFPRGGTDSPRNLPNDVGIPVTPRLSSSATSEDQARAEELVEKLNQARGKRVPIMDNMLDLELDDDFEDEDTDADGDENRPRASLHTVAGELADQSDNKEMSLNAACGDVSETSITEAADEPPTDTAPQPNGSRRGKRTPVPSWDEIIFGQRPE
ncbi:septation protein SepH [Actinomycetaceae bacterium MB13-C1-2]|nr:septation protein SepH [Actinomycetaceae bacterium MB13-C1-2]